MVQRLDALKVAPDLDPRNYAAGARAIDAANDEMANSAMRAGNAIQQEGQRVSEAGKLIDRLKHQYVEGYSQSVKFEKSIENLTMAFATNNVTVEEAENILTGLHRQLGMMANAEDLAANGQHQLAAVVTSVNAKLSAQDGIADVAAAAQMRLANASKMAAFQQRNLMFQLNDIGVSLASGMNPLMVAAQQGSQIAGIYGPEEGGLGRALQETAKMDGHLVTKFAPVGLAVGAAAGMIAGLTYEINQATGANVGFGDTALAMWQLFAEGFMSNVKPALDQLAVWMIDIWNLIQPTLKAMGNGIVGYFDLAFRNIKTVWTRLPAAIGDVAIQTANWVIGAVEDMVNGSIGAINGLIDQAREKTFGLVNFGNLNTQNFGRTENPFAGAGADFAGEYAQNFADVLRTDYMGEGFGAIADRAVALSEMADETDEVSRSTAAANDNLTEFDRLMREGQSVFDATRTPFERMGMEIERLDGMLATGVISWETYARAVAKARADAVGSVFSMASEAGDLLGQIFEDNKAIAIAQAVLSAGEGIARTLGSYQFPYNVAMAALHAGVAVKQIQQIASTTKNSKSLPGGAPSAGAAVPATSAGPANSTNVSVTILGRSANQQEELEELFRQINEGIGDGMQIHLNGAQ